MNGEGRGVDFLFKTCYNYNTMTSKEAWKDALGLGALLVLITVVFVVFGVAEQARLDGLNGQQ